LQFSKGYSVVDFINEVEEELRKDEYNRLLRRYGPFYYRLLLSLLLLLVLLSSVNTQRIRQQEQHQLVM